MIFTESQLKAINTNKNALVSAGAGSGKTTVLSYRYVRLVEEKLAHSDEILTITFTKKATAEMKKRIRDLLVQDIKDNKCPNEELTRFLNASISTVDSFCSTIVRNKCIDYGFSPSFSIVDNDDFRKNLNEITLSLLKTELNKDIYKDFAEKIFSICSVSDVINFFISLADSNNAMFNIVSEMDPDISTNIYIKKIGELLSLKKRDTVKDLQEYIDSGLEKGENLYLYNKLLDLLSSEGYDFSELCSLYDQICNKTSTRISSKEVNADYIKALRDKIKRKSILHIISLESVLNEKEFIYCFYSLISLYEKEVNKYKRNNNILTFSDIIKLAIDILLKDLKIRNYYKNKFKYVMTDEFQDNNDDFKKLFYLLCENNASTDLTEGKLFMVGDEKQSIYRFRGADVSVFKEVKKTISESGGEFIELEENFRSEQFLVQEFNRWFKIIMGENNEKNYESDFSPLKYKHESTVEPKIIYHHMEEETEDNNSDESEDADNIESEAFSLAEFISEKILKTDEFLIPSKDGMLVRPTYSDICILLTKTTNQGKIEKALKLQGIPYHSDELKSVYKEALVSDFYSIISSTIYPDKLTEMAVKNSPLGSFYNSEILKNYCMEKTITEVLSYIYLDMGYRNFIISNPDNQVYEEHFKWLFALGCDFEKRRKCLSEFIDYLRSLILSDSLNKTAEKRELKILQDSENAVSIMTVHKSKGLEFPIVIIAQMQVSKKNDTSNLRAVMEDGFLYLPCMEICEKESDKKLVPPQVILKDIEIEHENAETKRLFYVAVTRACYHLILSDSSKSDSSKNKDKEKDTGLITFKTLFDKCRKTDVDKHLIQEITYKKIKKENTRSTGRIKKEDLEANKIWYDKTIEFNPNYQRNEISVTSLEEEFFSDDKKNIYFTELPIDNYLKANLLQQDFGTYVHNLISCTLKNTYMINNEKYDKSANILSDNFFNSSFYKGLKSCFIINSEVPYTMYDSKNDLYKEGIIDFIAENENEFIIVDFKTSLIKTDKVYIPQITEYVQAVHSLKPSKKISGYIFYLRDPENPVKVIQL